MPASPPRSRTAVPPDGDGLPLFDFHTHAPDAPAGQAFVCLPREALLDAAAFRPRPGVLYSAGVHPWWCGETDDERLWQGVARLAGAGCLAAIGECGFDRLRGNAARQAELFGRHAALADRLGLPLIIHCVRAADRLLAARKALRPTAGWTLHGFRGGPALARQLLDAGIDLSFGPRFNAGSVRLCPADRLHIETDGSGADLAAVRKAIIQARRAPLPQ